MTTKKLALPLVAAIAALQLMGCGGPAAGAELEPSTKDSGQAVGRLKMDSGAESVTGSSSQASSDK